jgi:hypothetical protein
MGVITAGQHYGRLHQQVERQGGERIADQPQPAPLEFLAVPDSSQITTVDAPISISESSTNPASATDRAEIAAIASASFRVNGL